MSLDSALEWIFDVATAWKDIIFIDEADVFLEQRSLHHLKRNAIVAVLYLEFLSHFPTLPLTNTDAISLRHVEYYHGILFLTTNCVKEFDEAFLLRIHVALHFSELTQESKEQVSRRCRSWS